MERNLVDGEIGHSGVKYDVGTENGMLKVQLEYPIVKILEPIKANFVDKLKKLIPGSWDDLLIDEAWAEAVALAGGAPTV